MSPFDRFNNQSKKILKVAENIAQDMDTETSSDHILLALASVGDNLASEMLKNNNINLDRIHLAVSLSYLNKRSNRLGLSDEGRELIEKSLIEAKNFGAIEVNPEYIFLAILNERSFLGHQILTDLGLDTNDLKNQLIEIISGESTQDSVQEETYNSDEMLDDKFGEFGKIGDLFNEPFFGNALKQVMEPRTTQESALEHFTIDLTRKAREGALDPIIGRETEIKRVLRILNRRTKNNPVLVGEPGVGKTAIVEGLAQKIVGGQVPKKLMNRRVLGLDLALLLAGTKYRGEFEERIKKVTEEIIKARDVILFIDEIHTIVGAGSAEGAMDAANILKPALARGDLRLVGATTLDDYRKNIEKDPALERRLQQVKVDEPTTEDTLKILKGIRKKYEEHHEVLITDKTLKAAVDLSERYISDRFLPDKAIDLIDEAASEKAMSEDSTDPNLAILKTKYDELEAQKDELVRRENFKDAAQIKAQQEILRKKIMSIGAKNHKNDKSQIQITPEDIAKVVSEWTKIPVSSLVESEVEKFKNLEKILKTKIKGQDQAVAIISKALRRSRTGVSVESRPLGSFIFMGPTGVGKTELARILASEIFESEEALIKIDMSEFMEKHNISRLVGAPPGYVGFEEAGKLTEAVRQRPYSVVLFDEIEKAHPDIQNILLQILEDGYLTDAKGRRVNFRNTIIIMTSNIGLRELNNTAAVGFKAKSTQSADIVKNYEQTKDYILKELKRFFRPEFLNRIDQVIVFNPLDRTQVMEIVELRLSELDQRLKTQDIKVKFSRPLKEKIAQSGFDPENGARPIRRAIADLIETPFADEILKGKIKKTHKKSRVISVDYVNNQVVFK